jgi:hypothetical protein
MERTASTFKVEDGEMFFPQKFIYFYQTIRRHIKGDSNVNIHRLENLTFHELDTV